MAYSCTSPTHARSVLQTILLKSVRAYQLLLSPLLGSRCRFYPCCSNYAIAAIETHGCRKGTWLAVCRVARCNPAFAGGNDPVPEAASNARN